MPAMTEGVQPIPRRWWWTKRVVPVIAIFTAGVIGTRIWWGRHANRLLQEQLDLIRSRGEPLEWKELAPEPIPDSENAAELYKQAIDTPLLRPRPEVDISIQDWLRGERPPEPKDHKEAERRRRLKRLESMLDPLRTYADFRREHPRDLEEVLALSKDALALCRQARRLKRSDWKLDFSGPALKTSMNVYRYRLVAKLLTLATLHAHEAGDDARAVEHARDALALSRSMGQQPTLVSCLAAQGISRLALNAIEATAPTTTAAPRPPAAAREQVKALIHELLDEQTLRDISGRGFGGERSLDHDISEQIIADIAHRGRKAGPQTRLVLFTVEPMFRLDQVRILRHLTGYVEAVKQPTLPAATACLTEVQAPDSKIKQGARLLSLILTPSFGRAVQLHYEHMARRRMAATALAVRLYELDKGKRPERLDELEPEYLPTVPKDPFSPSDRKILYRPDGNPPLLYCIGANGQDDGGTFDADGDGLPDTEAPDCVFFLNGDRPVGKCDWQDPTTRPATPTRMPFTLPRGINPGRRTSAPAS